MPERIGQNPNESVVLQDRRKRFEKCTDKEQTAVEIVRELMELEQTVKEKESKQRMQMTRARIVGYLRRIIGDNTAPSESFHSDEIEPMAKMLLEDGVEAARK